MPARWRNDRGFLAVGRRRRVGVLACDGEEREGCSQARCMEMNWGLYLSRLLHVSLIWIQPAHRGGLFLAIGGYDAGDVHGRGGRPRHQRAHAARTRLTTRRRYQGQCAPYGASARRINALTRLGSKYKIVYVATMYQRSHP